MVQKRLGINKTANPDEKNNSIPRTKPNRTELDNDSKKDEQKEI